jgi:hypothetical protein
MEFKEKRRGHIYNTNDYKHGRLINNNVISLKTEVKDSGRSMIFIWVEVAENESKSIM